MVCIHNFAFYSCPTAEFSSSPAQPSPPSYFTWSELGGFSSAWQRLSIHQLKRTLPLSQNSLLHSPPCVQGSAVQQPQRTAPHWEGHPPPSISDLLQTPVDDPVQGCPLQTGIPIQKGRVKWFACLFVLKRSQSNAAMEKAALFYSRGDRGTQSTLLLCLQFAKNIIYFTLHHPIYNP